MEVLVIGTRINSKAFVEGIGHLVWMSLRMTKER